jgi:hypothetical protein
VERDYVGMDDCWQRVKEMGCTTTELYRTPAKQSLRRPDYSGSCRCFDNTLQPGQVGTDGRNREDRGKYLFDVFE